MTAEVVQPAEEAPKVVEKKKFELLNVMVEKVTGTVKWFSVRRHYGFIQRDDNKEDIFVHRTAITASRSRFPTLKNGETVEFSVVETTGGVNAASVTGPNGQQVKGVYFYRRRPKPSGEEGEGAPETNGTANADGDVEGSRPRGRPNRMRRRRPTRSSQNGQGDGETTGGEGADQVTENGEGVDGAAPRPRGGPRRGGRGRFGRGRQRSTSNKQVAGEGDEGAVTGGEEGANGDAGAPRQRQRGGGRFRRNGGGGGRNGNRRGNRQNSGVADAAATPAEASTGMGDKPGDDLATEVEKMKIDTPNKETSAPDAIEKPVATAGDGAGKAVENGNAAAN